ncbi:mucin-4-like [Pyxicephalus adspersus]|uniref:mucin-4-like n=1 Tax=Pyxicephalus adspersus TaxID=30357 RepID=UPI003B5A3EBB
MKYDLGDSLIAIHCAVNTDGVWFGNFTARFTYKANITVIKFLNEELVDHLTPKLSSTLFEKLPITNVTSGEMLTLPELAKETICVPGYKLNPDTFECVSKCIEYCKNDGICELIGDNPTCTCKPFTIYVTYGERCENLSMNLNAFFGILFGSLAFLFLLILGIVLGMYFYRRRNSKNDFDDTDELYQRRFSWKSSLFPSFQRMGNKDNSSISTEASSEDWTPHLEKVNSTAEVKIKRPEIKPNVNNYE